LCTYAAAAPEVPWTATIVLVSSYLVVAAAAGLLATRRLLA
jgi:hypothetical protein